MPKKIVQKVQSDLGNTETKSQPKKGQQIATKRYCFTKNDIPQNEEEAKEFYRAYSAKIKQIKNIIFYVFSLELGENERTYHLQGYIELSVKARITEFKEIEGGAHFIKSKGTKQQNIDYCSKGDTHIEGPTIWDKLKEPKYSPQQLGMVSADDLWEFQKEILKIARGPIDDRKIYWFYSTETGTGKTQVAKHLMYYDDFGLVNGDNADIMCAILGKDGKKDLKKGYLFNFSNDKNLKKVSYASMEQMKDGLLFSTKYESGGILIPPLNVVCFANGPPVMKYSNRWRIYEIKNKKIILKNPHEQDFKIDHALKFNQCLNELLSKFMKEEIMIEF